MWFSPLKGAHLTLGQLDKTLPVDKSVAANAKIERGSFVYISTDKTATGVARFALYGQVTEDSTTVDVATKPNAVPYIALMGINDFQAGMAGNVGQASIDGADGADPAVDVNGNEITAATGNALTFLGKSGVVGASGIVGPRITAISVVQPAEYQTTAFEKTVTVSDSTTAITYYVGQPLTISANGKLTPFTTGHNIVGYVTAVPKTRWINDLGSSVDGARISGGNAKVLEFSTAWIPASNGGTATNASGTPGSSDTVKMMGAKAPAAPAAAKPATPAK